MDVIRCKVALVGDTRVGKTSIINHLVKNNFNNTYQTTLGIDYNQYETSIKDTPYTVQFHILDFSAFSIYKDLLNNQIKDANFILYVYDSTNLESFQNIKLWKQSIDELGINRNAIQYLVGNKIEIPEKIVTDKSSVDTMAKTLKLQQWEVSARMLTNVPELFTEMAKQYYASYTAFIDKVKKFK